MTPDQSKVSKISFGIMALALVLLVAVLPYAAGYADLRKPIMRILLARWFDEHSTTWQYGVLVPFVVGWLVWRKRDRLAHTPVSASGLGLPVMITALLSYYAGFKANNYYFGFLAIQLFTLGSVLWVFGKSWAKELRFPWLVLGFVWPLVFLEDRIGFPLRMISTQGVMAMARLVHAPITAEGTSLYSSSMGQDLGSWMTLKVDGPCSGMNTLFALMFVSVLFSCFAQRTNPRRVILFICSIPLALVGNMLRIGLLIGGCALFGQKFAVGDQQNEMTTYHLFSGLVVFPVLVFGLQIISRQLNKLVRREAGRTRANESAMSTVALH